MMSPKTSKPRQYLSTEEMEKRLAEIIAVESKLTKAIEENVQAHNAMYDKLSKIIQEQREEIVSLRKEIKSVKEELENRRIAAKRQFYCE